MMPELTFEQKIEKALKDTAKGLATKEEARQYVTDEVANHLAESEHIKALNSSVTALKEQNDDLLGQIKHLRTTKYAAIRGSGGDYYGCWSNLQQAKAFGLYVLGYVCDVPNARETFKELTGIEVKQVTDKAMSENDNSAGGYLVPEEFVPRLIVLIQRYGAYRRNVAVWPMSSDVANAPKLDSDVTVYCPGAGVEPSKSDPSFSNIQLVAKKWLTLTAIDSELTEDSAIAVGEIVGRSIARAIAKQEDKCGFVGDGTSTYFGEVGARVALAAVDSTKSNIAGLHVQDTAGAWSAIDLDDLLAVAGLQPSDFDDEDSKFYCSKAFYFSVMLSNALGAGGAMASEVIATGYTPNPSFLGRQVEFTPAMPSSKEASDHCPLLLANLQQGAWLGDRSSLTIDRSDDVYFGSDRIGIRGRERVAFNNFGVGDTSDAGPIVGLWADIS
jgi:HK97 family phage major capsid protein